ncbi:DUF4407 domain-containing protein [Dactylosporangium sp. NPDC051484]|uniref:DUF4407 domain-containing protein n=1 Tax=Dactylosporangium sp. NPDC051484 TaxID=3154942 RepID=UPI00344EF0A5
MTTRAGQFLYSCAGADRAHLKSRTERAWYQALGLSVLLTALASSVSMTFALTLSLGGPWWAYTPFSLLWAVFVFNIDRWLVSTIHYGKLDETNDGKTPITAGRVVGYIARFAFAGVLAVVIAEPIVLQIFHREIDQQVAVTKAAALKQAELEVRARPEIVAERDRIDNRKKAADEELVNARDAQKKANEALDAEINGTGGSRTQGCKQRCNERRNDVQQADGRVATAEQTAKDVTAATNTDNPVLEKRIADLVAEQATKIDGGDGLLAREKALTQLMRDNPELATRRWFVSLLFLLIDIVPLLLKTFSPTTNHDRDVRLAAVAYAQLHGLEYWQKRIGQESQAHAEQADLKLERKVNRGRLRHYLLTEQDKMEIARQVKAAQLEHAHLSADLEAQWRAVSNVTEPAGFGMPAPPKPTAPESGQTAPPVDTVPMTAPSSTPWTAPMPWTVPPPVTVPMVNGSHGPASIFHQPPPPGPAPAPGPFGGAVIVGGRWVLGTQLLSAEPGGFGLPFLAHDIANPKLHAVLKRIRPRDDDPQANERALRYLRKEQSQQALVHSAFVAPVLDAGDDPQFGPYLATPHYAFGTIWRRIHEPTFTPTLEWALRVAEQVLTGLIDCHDQASLIHLDIKPSNIALDDDGNVQLIDFGLARSLDDADGPSSVVPAFSRWYAAPEQIRRVKVPDWKTSAADVRAVAATIYEIISGRPPLRREAAALGIDVHDPDAIGQVIRLICDREIRPARLDTLVPGVPGYVADLIDQWLAHDPQQRASGPRPFAVHNAAEALGRVQERVHADGLDSLPVGRAHAVNGDYLGHVAPAEGPRVQGVELAADSAAVPPPALGSLARIAPRRVMRQRGQYPAEITVETQQEMPAAAIADAGRYFDVATED